jgi:putative membrane protein
MLLMAIATLLLLFACTNSQTNSSELVTSTGNTNYVNTDSLNKAADVKFITKAAESYLKEIKIGELAKEKGQSADVKALGEMMVLAHTHSLKDLTALAIKKNIVVPSQADKATEDTYNRLKMMPANEFDKEYCYISEMDHNRAIALFEEASEESTDEDIKKMAGNMLTDFDTHLYHIVACLNKLETKTK